MKREHKFNLWYWVVAFLVIAVIQYFVSVAEQVASIPYSEFQQLLRDHKVSEVRVSDRFIQGVLKEPLPSGQTRFATTRVEPPELADELEKQAIRLALQECDWFEAPASRLLDVNRSTLKRLLQTRHKDLGDEASQRREAAGYKAGNPHRNTK